MRIGLDFPVPEKECTVILFSSVTCHASTLGCCSVAHVSLSLQVLVFLAGEHKCLINCPQHSRSSVALSFMCGLLQDEAGVVLESPEQRA
jgi:hypothetical protein